MSENFRGGDLVLYRYQPWIVKQVDGEAVELCDGLPLHVPAVDCALARACSDVEHHLFVEGVRAGKIAAPNWRRRAGRQILDRLSDCWRKRWAVALVVVAPVLWLLALIAAASEGMLVRAETLAHRLLRAAASRPEPSESFLFGDRSSPFADLVDTPPSANVTPLRRQGGAGDGGGKEVA